MTAKPTRELIAALAEDGADVRLVGGPVRDALLGRESVDIDIGTPDPPQRVMALLSRARIGIRAVPRGIEHGTVIAVHEDNRYEITTLRRDVRTYGRHANVAFTADWEADAARRDFTINAMSATPDPDNMLYDFFDGQDDLKAGRVRFVGDPATRIAEDHLRLLRFFRFFAWYGKGEPDEAALNACSAEVHRIQTLSGERVQAEMLKMLEAPDPLPALSVLQEAGVLAQLLPEAQGTERLARLVAIERDAAEPAAPIRRLAALMAGSDDAGAVAERWRLKGNDLARLTELLVSLSDVITTDLDPLSQRRRLYDLGKARFKNLVLLAWAAEKQRDRDKVYRAMLKTADEWEAPTLPISGADVIARGIAEGSEVGQLLRRVQGWWTSHDFKPSRAEALAHLDSLTDPTKSN